MTLNPKIKYIPELAHQFDYEISADHWLDRAYMIQYYSYADSLPAGSDHLVKVKNSVARHHGWIHVQSNSAIRH